MAAKNSGYDVDLGKLPSSISILFANDDGIENLKVIEGFKKQWKKAKSVSNIDYL